MMPKGRSSALPGTEREGSTSIPPQGNFDERMAKIQALATLEKMNPKVKGIWILETAGFSRNEITKILHVGTHTIQDVLDGKELKEE